MRASWLLAETASGLSTEIKQTGEYKHEKKEGEIGYHWYGGSPISQQYEAITNSGDYKMFNNTMKKIIDEVLR